jgi:pyruvate formate lyase activating enzyme
MEYAIDIADACHAEGIRAVAVTAGEMCLGGPAEEFYAHIDAANVDLKAFTESFYRNVCGGHLQPVLDLLAYLKHQTRVWFEITNLMIPGENDDPGETRAMCEWILERLGPDVPVHVTAFHPDWKMLDRPATPPATLRRARAIAREVGLRYAYTGNVHDEDGGSTYCHGCGARIIGRDWYEMTAWELDERGHCLACGTPCAGVFSGPPGDWGSRRLPVRLALFDRAAGSEERRSLLPIL